MPRGGKRPTSDLCLACRFSIQTLRKVYREWLWYQSDGLLQLDKLF